MKMNIENAIIFWRRVVKILDFKAFRILKTEIAINILGFCRLNFGVYALRNW